MNLALWLRFALRDLRSGLQGFWIFFTCLALGTATIALIGALAASVERGLNEQGQPLLGGDVEFSLIHREVDARERAYIESKGQVSTVGTLRAMAVAGENTTLAEVKAVDAAYPLYGALTLEGGVSPAGQLEAKNGTYGVLVDPLLLGRLSLKTGDKVKLGDIDLDVRGVIAAEPDRISSGIVLGPRMLVNRQALQATGLVQPGSLITWGYRVKLPGNPGVADARELVKEAERDFPNAGWRLRASDQAASGAERFVERLAYFLTLVGLTSLIVGGAGIANAVSAFVARKGESIATLKCLGAPSRDVFGIYLTEILLVALLAITAGLVVGLITPPIAYSALSGMLPLPLTPRIEWVPLAVAAALGFLVTIAFAVWPLARTRQVPASALFRSRIMNPGGWPKFIDLAVIALAFAIIAAIIFASFDDARITAYYLGGLAASFVVLLGLAWAIVALAARLPKPGGAIARYALSNIYRPGSAAISVILALGLGLTLFVTLALTDRTISNELRSGIPEKAPAYFFLDVRNDELANFVADVQKQPGVTSIETAPMMRGRMVSVKGVPADKVQAAPEAAWALRGDRGLTYADEIPRGSKLVEGQWWPKDYTGPNLVSMVDEIAHGIGVRIGDEITVNVLGRDVTAKVANLRQVNWRGLGINFVMVFSPNTLKAAPHSHIVTVEMDDKNEAALLNTMARAYPSATAVRVKDAIGIISDLLGKMLAAIRGANVMTLLTGVLVLAGALAAGLSGRIYDAVVLKTYGASRRQLIGALVIEYSALGLASAVFGIVTGSLASWFLARWILEMPWSFSLPTAILTALIAMLVTVLAGLAVTWRALSVKPAPFLRNE